MGCDVNGFRGNVRGDVDGVTTHEDGRSRVDDCQNRRDNDVSIVFVNNLPSKQPGASSQ